MTMREIIGAVAAVYGVSTTRVLGRRRHVTVARPRQVAMYLMRERLHHSYPAIGRRFAKDPTTVMHACRTIADLLLTDAELRQRHDQIIARLEGREEAPRARKSRAQSLLMLRAALDNADQLLRSLEHDEDTDERRASR